MCKFNAHLGDFQHKSSKMCVCGGAGGGGGGRDIDRCIIHTLWMKLLAGLQESH